MEYPPFGSLHSEHWLELEQKPFLPRLWPFDKRSHYYKWVGEMTQDIADGLWPKWDVKSHKWVGIANAHMDVLTAMDFMVLETLDDVMLEPATPTNGASVHLDFFYAEDGQGGLPGDMLQQYEPSLDPRLTNFQPSGFFLSGMDFVCGSTSLYLKRDLQRPRPHQIALMRGGMSFRWQALTADSPSMSSGHCFEGILAGAWVALRHAQWVPGLDWSIVEPAIQQWAVDIGDRRVFARVHYPSDNIASWWMALSFLARLKKLGAADASFLFDFVKGAIPKSRVYEALRQASPPGTLWPRLRKAVES